jgi:hypothetical protein
MPQGSLASGWSDRRRHRRRYYYYYYRLCQQSDAIGWLR